MTIEIMPANADIFASGADSLVDPVDCTGAQGKGLALMFRQRYAVEALAYKTRCREGLMWPGECFWTRADDGTWVAFLATKDHWRRPSRLAWVRYGLDEITHFVTMRRGDHEIRSVAIPALGCGLGELAWHDVRPLILDAAQRMSESGARVLIYPPHEARR